MNAALSIDFGNNYTKIGIRSGQNETSQALRSNTDLKYDDDHICIPTVAARVDKNDKETWLFGTEVKLGSNDKGTQVFRNWKPRFFRGEETHLDGEKTEKGPDSQSPEWSDFNEKDLTKLLVLAPEREQEINAVLRKKKDVRAQSDDDFDFKNIGEGYFSWLRRFVEPFCALHGIGTTHDIPVRITLPSFSANSGQAMLTLQTILKNTGWRPAVKQPAIPEPVANLIGTFSSGRNFVWRENKPGSLENCSLTAMIGESTLYKAIRAFARGSGESRSKIYWIMIADLGGYTTDFAMVGFDMEGVEINLTGQHDGK
jgi:hypothetical protein